MNNFNKLLLVLAVLTLVGCETAKQVTTKTGEVVGEGANVVGGLSEGGAEAVKGKETSEENPFGR